MNGNVRCLIAVFVITGIILLQGTSPLWSDQGAEAGSSRRSPVAPRRFDGNQMVEGHRGLPDIAPVDLKVPGRPIWLTVGVKESTSFWIVVIETGQVVAFRLDGYSATEIRANPNRLPAGMPPGFAVDIDPTGNAVSLLDFPKDASTLTSPVPLAGRTAYVANNGDLVLASDAGSVRLPVKALPDAVILVDDSERLLLLTDPTDRYDHGILGDRVEAASITLVETQAVPPVLRTIVVPEPEVIEGLAPIWVDLDGDDQREIIVTISDARQGARLVVFDEKGKRLASGPAIGQGHRWRHQLSAARFGPAGEMEIADVLTPHIGGVVEFFRVEGERLRRTAALWGYSSHRIGSRNLGMALAGDFDRDGRIELLVPELDHRDLTSIRRTEGGAEVVWTLPVNGYISTNLAAAVLASGNVVLGVGRTDGVIRLWPAE